MEKRTYPEFSSRYPLLLKTFMKRPVDLYPNEIGIVYRNPHTAHYQRFTWLEWYRRTCQLANALKDFFGIKPGKANEPGDRIATMALNTHRHLELYYAVPCSGAVLHPINVRLSPEHIVYTITHAEDKIIFFDDLMLPLIEAIYDYIKDVVEQFIYMSDNPGLPKTKIKNLSAYEELLAKQSSDYDWSYLDEDTFATLCYTTATTGQPKGAMFTHRALYLQTLHMIALATFANTPEYETVNRRFGENNVAMINIPMFHIHAWGAPFLSVFSAAKTVLPGMFTVDGFCELVQTEKVTATSLVPTMVALLLEYKDLEKYDLSSLVNLGVGGGALSLGLKTKCETIMPHFRMASGYGMTETAPTTITAFIKKYMVELPKEEIDEVLVKTGIPVPGIEVQVVDEKGRPVPKDNEALGEIVMRGPWVIEQYYKNPDQTALVWRNGWFHTGDLAKVDEHGFIIIGDRQSDVIRSGSEMIPSVLLENLIALADFVLEAAVIGVPDPVWGESPMAIIKLAPGCSHKEKDIIEFLRIHGVEKGKITKWMLPKLIAFCDDIPKTSVGKYNKREIKKQLDRFLALAREM